jgi:glycosyltransferase involved in cell wall biosynthesis
MVPEKAPHEAFRLAPTSVRRIRRAGPVGNAEYFRSSVEPLLGPDVEYLGHLGVPALQDLVGSSAALVVTPEWDEPYGLVAAESLACGTPVVGYRRGGLPEFVAPGCGVLVEPGDVAAAAAEVDGVCATDRARCREHAETSCSLDTMVDAYLARYERLTATLGRAA